MDDPLFCIVCGFERGGTTLIAELIRQDPGIDGRFECGFLLVDRISDYASMDVFVRNLKAGWGLSEESFNYILQAQSHKDAYKRLVERSNLPDKNVRIYDKTPRYMLYLSDVLKKTDVPCICVVRDPRALYWSKRKRYDHEKILHQDYGRLYRLKSNLHRIPVLKSYSQKFLEREREKVWLKGFCLNFLRFANAWKSANQLFPERILLVSHDKLCINPSEETRRIYDFLGLQFKEEYIKLPTTPDPYVNRGGIVKEMVYEYKDGLSRNAQDYILKGTKAFSEWHWLQ